jgi:uncharacterized protein (DUF1778 family)
MVGTAVTVREARSPQSKSHQVAIRYTAPEYDLIAAAAALAGQDFGPYVRNVAVSASRSVLATLMEGG